MDVFEAIHSQRAMRRLKTDPVPEELIWKVLDAAIRAPNASNQQPWNFIVIRHPETRKRVGELYHQVLGPLMSQPPDQPEPDPKARRTHSAVAHLADHLGEVPVLILVTFNHSLSSTSLIGSSIYPAVQNLMLAARALGLGTVLTTSHTLREAQVKELLGIPEEVETVALIPLGWPEGRFGPTDRRPIEQVAHWDKWGATKQR